MWWKEVGPLCLVLRVREGLVGVLEGRQPLHLVFRAREGLVVEGEVELQQVVKFNMHVTCHVIFGAQQSGT